VGYWPPALVVNEFMADNDNVIEDPDEPLAYEDWLEIYNAGDQAATLDGMYLTDNLFLPTKFALPLGLVVPAGGHLLFWADLEPLQGPTHLGFRLAAAGEEIGLYDSDARGNLPIDTLTFGLQLLDVSEGRCPDGFALLVTMDVSSPQAPNLDAGSCTGGLQSFFGAATGGGEIQLTVEGVLVVVATTVGQTARQVAAAVAAAINADPTLSGLGVLASSHSTQLATTGTIDAVESTDPGISLISGGAPSVPSLGAPAFLLLVLLTLATGTWLVRARGRSNSTFVLAPSSHTSVGESSP